MINVQIGSCGIHLGTNFWEDLSNEYGLDESGKPQNPNLSLPKLHLHYNESLSGHYKPRSIIADLCNDSQNFLNSIKSNIQCNPENCIFSYGPGHSWPNGFYSDGNEILDKTLDIIRKETEKCEIFQGFQFFHSLGGGTGSGFGSLLLSKLKDQYAGNFFTAFSVFPSFKVSDNVIEPYNALLGINYLIEYADGVMVFDNDALHEMCFRRLKISSPDLNDFNYLASMAISGATCFYRLPVEGFNSLSKLVVNLVPEPRLHFFSIALAPVISRGSTCCQLHTVSSLTTQIQNPTNTFCAFDPQMRKNLASVAIYRGNMHSEEIYNEIFNMKNQCLDKNFNNNMKISICNTQYKYIRKSCTLISNSSAVTGMFDRIYSDVSSMFRRKAFLYGYCRDGMDEMEITEAQSNLSDLISEYKSIEV